MIQFYSTRKKPKLSRKKYFEFFEKNALERSIFFISFTTVKPSIPIFDDTKPKEKCCVMYSVLYFESATGTYQQRNYFSKPGFDERKTLIENFIIDTEENCVIFLYGNSDLELLKQFALISPEKGNQIQDRIDRTHLISKFFENENIKYPVKQKEFTLEQVLEVTVPNYLNEYKAAKISSEIEASGTYLRINNLDIVQQIETQWLLQGYGNRNAFALTMIFDSMKSFHYKQTENQE